MAAKLSAVDLARVSKTDSRWITSPERLHQCENDMRTTPKLVTFKSSQGIQQGFVPGKISGAKFIADLKANIGEDQIVQPFQRALSAEAGACSHFEITKAIMGGRDCDSTRLHVCLEQTARAARSDLLSPNDLLKLYSATSGSRHKGSLRDGAMWVGGNDPSLAWFTAPPPSELKGLLDDLAGFCRTRGLPQVIKGAVAMNQLLLIHPFRDANGRTARALFFSFVRPDFVGIGYAIRLIAQLWIYRGLDLHRLQLPIKQEGDWGPFLKFVLAAVADSPFHWSR